jgi:hypothetical protein
MHKVSTSPPPNAAYRVRVFFEAWAGHPLNAAQVSALVGLLPSDAIVQALHRLARTGELKRVGRGLYVAGEPLCRADRDGECFWHRCPQIRDDEPKKSGRHCPYDREVDE